MGKKLGTKASKAKSDFLMIMTHEMRTPINSIVGLTELALRDDLSTKAKNYLEGIHENSQWLLLIINDILDLSRIESGKLELENIPFEVNELLATCRSLMIPKALEKGLVLNSFIEQTADITITGDPTRLRQVLINLLSNAIKFTDHGEIEISSDIIGSDKKHTTLRFTVADTGIGITDEQMGKIFEPFTQGDASITRKYGGTGLGLTICKDLVELMGGSISVKSTYGAGSKFSFELEFKKAKKRTETSGAHAAVKYIMEPAFRGTVLVCEDNRMNQKIICDYLARVGLETIVASSGEEAIDLISRRINRREKDFDLILMDIHMPSMDGFETAAKIAQLKTKTPIVAMTANNITRDKQIYKAAGMDDYLGKPLRAQELWRCLLKYFTPLNKNTAGNVLNDQIDEDMLLQLRVDFAMDNQTVFKDITGAIRTGKAKKAHRLAHTLKSNAGLIGEKLLQKAASNIEEQLEDGKNIVTDKNLDTLEIELKTVLEKLTAMFEKKTRRSTDKTQNASFSAEKSLKLIDRIEPLIKNGNPECLEYIDELKTIPESVKLIKQMKNFDFFPAIKTLSELKKALGAKHE